MKRPGLVFTLLLLGLNSFSQGTGPEITSWILNSGNETGYNSISSNIQSIEYSTSYVYIRASCIPGYDIGPWAANPNQPANQDFVFKFTRNPTENTGTKTSTPMGHIGTWTNGVSIFNALDGFSYNDLGIWNQDAIPNEGISFDDCLGHPAGNGEYHHHLNPTCLYDDTDSLNHSPIIGFAFDGFPIYGAYAFGFTNGLGNIKRMNSSYQLRNMSFRTTKPDGTALNNGQFGPSIDANYPLGSFIEDYEYVAGSGDLDEYNGRFSITPEYPQGTYAYFVTIDENLKGVYPYVLGPQYYGNVTAGNTGPGSGHNIPTEAVSIVSGIEEEKRTLAPFSVYPNPSISAINIDFSTIEGAVSALKVFNSMGNLVKSYHLEGNAPSTIHHYLNSGLYHLLLETSSGAYSSSLVVR